MRNVFSKKLTSELTEIEMVANGFFIKEPFGAKPKLLFWQSIKKVRFSKSHKAIIIEKTDEQFVLKNNSIGWYEFIQNVPSNYVDFDFEYVKAFMESLVPCKICGIVAVRENECIVCDTLVWNNTITENEIEYIKSKQSEFNSELLEKGIEIERTVEPEYGFKADKDWELYI